MGTIANPLASVIDGLLKGHELGLQMDREKRSQQEFMTQQAMHNQQMSMQDIFNQQYLQEHARPVTDMGTVESPAGPSIPNTAPGMPSSPGAPSYIRKADPSRTVKYGGRQYEFKTPEAQDQAKLEQQTRGMDALQAAKDRAAINSAQALHQNQLKLEGGGTPAQGLAMMGVPDGTLLTRDELSHYTQGLTAHLQSQQALEKGDQVLIGPGQQLLQRGTAPGPAAAAPTAGLPGQPAIPMEPMNVPGQATAAPAAIAAPGAAAAPRMRVLATGGSPIPTGEFGTYLRAELMKKGFTEANAPPDIVSKAVTDYANKTKDPAALAQAQAMHALTMQLTQARLDDLKSKQGASTVDYQPGSREYKVAQDLAYGRLTMQQFRSLTGYSRDVNKKMDIYQKATELNPNFNPAQFEMGFKFAANPKTQQQLSSMDNVVKGADDLLKFSDAASRSGVTALNKYINPAGIALGGKKYSDFHTAQIAFADELSGALGFGGATDMSKEMGLDMTNPNLSPENFRSAVQNVVLPFIERKRRSLLDQMGTYGQPGMNPAAGPAGPAAPVRGTVAPIGGPGQQKTFDVTDPRGKVHQFPSQQAADAFKQAAGIR